MKAELNCEIYKSEKLLEKSSQFLSSEQLSEPESLDVPLNIAGVQKRPSDLAHGCGQPTGHLIPVLNERSVSDDENFCLNSVVGDSQISMM